MPHFTTTDSLKFRSFLVAHGVDASTAEKVAAKVQRKMQRNKPLTAEESALVDGYISKAASNLSAGANVAQKVMPGRLKWQDITLKKGYTDTSQKVSELSFKYFRPSGKLHTRVWGDPHLSNKAQMLSNKATILSNKATPLSNKAQMLSNKAQKVSVYSPGTVRQLAYKVVSS